MAKFNTKKFIELQRTKGIPDEITYDFLMRKGIDPDLDSQNIRKGIGGTAETLFDMFGGRAAFEFGKMPTQVLETALSIPIQEALAEAKGGLADSTTKLIKRARGTPEGERKEKMKKIIMENAKELNFSREAISSLEEGFITEQEVAGKTINALMTAATTGPGKGGKITGLPQIMGRTLPTIPSKMTSSLIGKMGRGAVLGVGFTAGRQLEEKGRLERKGLLTAAAIGIGIPIALEAGKITVNFVRGVLKRAGGIVSGKGQAVLDEILENPQEARAGLKLETDKEAADLLKQKGKQIRGAIQKLQKEARDEWGRELDKLPKEKLSMSNLMPRLNNILREANINVTFNKKGIPNFSGAVIDRSDENILKKVFKLVAQQKDLSPREIDQLAIVIGKASKSSTNELVQGLLGRMKKETRNFLADELVDVSPMVRQYANKMGFVEEASYHLSVKGAFSSAKGIDQTAQKLNNIFGRNKEIARDIVRQLEVKGGKNILASIAGKELTEVPIQPPGITGAVRGIFQSVIPPKTIGDIAVATGIAQQKLVPIMKGLNKLGPAARLAFFNMISAEIAKTPKEEIGGKF